MERVKVIKMRKVKQVEKIDPTLEFLTALDAIVKEKGIDRQIVVEAMETAMANAYKKNEGVPTAKAKLNEETGELKIYTYKTSTLIEYDSILLLLFQKISSQS